MLKKAFFTGAIILSGFLYLISSSGVYAQLGGVPQDVTVGGTGSGGGSNIPEIGDISEGCDAVAEGDVNLPCHITGSVHFQAGALVDLFIGGVTTWYNGEKKISSTTGSALGGGVKAIAFMYEQPPASTHTYVADLMNSAGFAQPAYAQGLGFSSLSPILETWKVFRNMAYLFFVFIILIIGFLIMLRKKVGQAAVTAQQALPKIILALIAVTFSYAIAGLLIDFMYVLMFMIVGIFDPGLSNLATGSIFSLGYSLIMGTAGDAFDATSSAIENLIEIPVLDQFAATFGGITAVLIVAIAMTIAIFKLFFELLKTYVNIIISIALSPLLLMMDAIPGKSFFGGWIWSLIGNLAVFPTVILVIMMYHQIVRSTGGIQTGGFAPPYLLGNALGSADAIAFLVGLGLVLGLPEAVTKVKSAFGVSDGFLGDILKAGWSRANTGRKAVSLLPKSAIGMTTGMGPETFIEKNAMGSRAYRQRQREIALMTKGQENAPYVQTMGGLLGWKSKIGNKNAAHQRQIETEKAQMEAINKRLDIYSNRTKNTDQDVGDHA